VLEKIDPLKGPITRPVVVRQEEGAEQRATHRGGGRKSEIYGFFDPERGIRMRAGITTYTPERYNPRHRHTDEAVRYYYRGAECYGRDVMEEGDCVYVPEGVYYGPTRTAEKCDHNVRISLHFPGPSGFPTPVWPEVMKAQKEMREKQVGQFEKGLFIWPNGKKQDAFEAVQEYIVGSKLKYPEPRYRNYIIMRHSNYSWVPLEGAPGVSVKHLGYFNERGPNIKLMRMEKGAETPQGEVNFQQVRLVLEGEVDYDGEKYQPVSCMFFPAGAPYAPTRAVNETTLLVTQLGMPGSSPLPFCVL
jgi:hypothetical protein